MWGEFTVQYMFALETKVFKVSQNDQCAQFSFNMQSNASSNHRVNKLNFKYGAKCGFLTIFCKRCGLQRRKWTSIRNLKNPHYIVKSEAVCVSVYYVSIVHVPRMKPENRSCVILFLCALAQFYYIYRCRAAIIYFIISLWQILTKNWYWYGIWIFGKLKTMNKFN